VHSADPNEDRAAIRTVLARYCQLCDDGRFEEWGLLFTDDAVFSVLGRDYIGRDAVVTFIAGAQPPEARGKHLISEPVITVDGDHASVRTDYAFIGRQGARLEVTSTGRYVDRFVRTPDGWRFASRRIVFLGDEA
jgi:3-phenylpropionate/cinnamic acid dioxygenase small subunit